MRYVPAMAPRIMIRISGTAVPRKTQPTIAGLGSVAWEVARVVVAVLGPAEPAQRDREGEADHEGLPPGAVCDGVQLGVAREDPGEDREEDDEREDQQPQDLHDRGVAEERQHRLERYRDEDHDHLHGVPGSKPAFARDDEDRPRR